MSEIRRLNDYNKSHPQIQFIWDDLCERNKRNRRHESVFRSPKKGDRIYVPEGAVLISVRNLRTEKDIPFYKEGLHYFFQSDYLPK